MARVFPAGEMYGITDALGEAIERTVTSRHTVIRQWIAQVEADGSSHRFIGFETMSFYVNRRNVSDQKKKNRRNVGIIGFSVGGRCLVVQAHHLVPICRELHRFLLDSNNTFVGMNIRRKLDRVGKELKMRNYAHKIGFIDLKEYAAYKYKISRLRRRSWATLVARCSVQASRSIVVALPEIQHDWGRRFLTPQQLEYTCIRLVGNFRMAQWLGVGGETGSGIIEDIDIEITKSVRTHYLRLSDKYITTTVSRQMEAAASWAQNIRSIHGHCFCVGFDMYKVNPTRHNIQLCVEWNCLIFELSAGVPVPVPLLHFFKDISITFVGLEIEDKLQRLQEVYGIGGTSKFYDLRHRAAEHYRRPYLNNADILTLSKAILGCWIERPQVGLNTEVIEILTNSQVQLASLNVYDCHRIGEALHFAA